MAIINNHPEHEERLLDHAATVFDLKLCGTIRNKTKANQDKLIAAAPNAKQQIMHRWRNKVEKASLPK